MHTAVCIGNKRADLKAEIKKKRVNGQQVVPSGFHSDDSVFVSYPTYLIFALGSYMRPCWRLHHKEGDDVISSKAALHH